MLTLLARLHLVFGSEHSIFCAPWLQFCSPSSPESGRLPALRRRLIPESGGSSAQSELCCLLQTPGFNETFYCFQHSVLSRSQLDSLQQSRAGRAWNGVAARSQFSQPSRVLDGAAAASPLPGCWRGCEAAAFLCGGCRAEAAANKCPATAWLLGAVLGVGGRREAG